MAQRPSNISAGETVAAGGTIEFEDAALVERCRGGDMQAFAALVAKYQDRVLNTILRLCGNVCDAEELAQETFLKALEKLSLFRGQSKFYTWLFRIAVNLTISSRRRGTRVRFHPLTGPDEADNGQGLPLSVLASRREPSPQAAAMSAEVSQRVTEALEQLDDEFRAVVVLRDIEDMDYAQIGEVLDLPVGTVKSRLHRARCALQAKLADLVT